MASATSLRSRNLCQLAPTTLFTSTFTCTNVYPQRLRRDPAGNTISCSVSNSEPQQDIWAGKAARVTPRTENTRVTSGTGPQAQGSTKGASESADPSLQLDWDKLPNKLLTQTLAERMCSIHETDFSNYTAAKLLDYPYDDGGGHYMVQLYAEQENGENLYYRPVFMQDPRLLSFSVAYNKVLAKAARHKRLYMKVWRLRYHVHVEPLKDHVQDGFFTYADDDRERYDYSSPRSTCSDANFDLSCLKSLEGGDVWIHLGRVIKPCEELDNAEQYNWFVRHHKDSDFLEEPALMMMVAYDGQGVAQAVLTRLTAEEFWEETATFVACQIRAGDTWAPAELVGWAQQLPGYKDWTCAVYEIVVYGDEVPERLQSIHIGLPEMFRRQKNDGRHGADGV